MSNKEFLSMHIDRIECAFDEVMENKMNPERHAALCEQVKGYCRTCFMRVDCLKGLIRYKKTNLNEMIFRREFNTILLLNKYEELGISQEELNYIKHIAYLYNLANDLKTNEWLFDMLAMTYDDGEALGEI